MPEETNYKRRKNGGNIKKVVAVIKIGENVKKGVALIKTGNETKNNM